MYDFTCEDLQDLGEIGRGGFGTVNKMIHKQSNTVMAVKVRIKVNSGKLSLSTIYYTRVNDFAENTIHSRRKRAKTTINGFGSGYEVQRMPIYSAVLRRLI